MMTLTDAYAVTEARSCLAALADTAPTVEASIAYERALLYIDSLVGDYVPGISSPAENDPERLLTRLEVAVGNW